MGVCNDYVYLGKDRLGLKHGETYCADIQSWRGGAKVVIPGPYKKVFEYKSLDTLLEEWAYVVHFAGDEPDEEFEKPKGNVAVTFTMKNGKNIVLIDWTVDGDRYWWERDDAFESRFLYLESHNMRSKLLIPVGEIAQIEINVRAATAYEEENE